MQTTTYYYNTGSGSGGSWPWTDVANILDSDDTTYGYDHIYDGDSGTTLSLTGHTGGSSVPNWKITKVEVGIKRANTDSQIDFHFKPFATWIDMAYVSSPTLTWYDITSYTGAPATWTNSDVQNLDVQIYAKNNRGYMSFLDPQVYIVYVRVSYNTLRYRKDGVTYDVEVYKDNTSMTHSIGMRIDGVTVYAAVGATDHANATPVRVRIGGTTYAILSQR